MNIEKVLYVEEMPKRNCNGGDYPEFILMQNINILQVGNICACGNGCSGTTSLSSLDYDRYIEIPFEDFRAMMDAYVTLGNMMDRYQQLDYDPHDLDDFELDDNF